MQQCVKQCFEVSEVAQSGEGSGQALDICVQSSDPTAVCNMAILKELWGQ